MKPALSWTEQVQLLSERGLQISSSDDCASFLSATNYYRFSGYARYFQRAPERGDNTFHPGTSFDRIVEIYHADELLRSLLTQQLEHAEVLLRTHTAYAIAHRDGAFGLYLDEDFYSRSPSGTANTVKGLVSDLSRSREPYILHFTRSAPTKSSTTYTDLPIWAAVEALSFGTLSRCIERGDHGDLARDVATSIGVRHEGFSKRVRTLVYLRNRCAHHSRLWHHSLVDAGPTPRNVRRRAKQSVGAFDARSVLDAVASLDDILRRSGTAKPILPRLAEQFQTDAPFWDGLAHPVAPQDHRP
jgi:abortive infection bacteriophage resistance protein